MTNKIQRFFYEQKDYIFCKKGCALCCKNAQFPYTNIEFQLILEGLKQLEINMQQTISENIKKIVVQKQYHKESGSKDKFRYDCPFLINDECSIYYYRGLVCRSFGLMTFLPNSEKTPRIPFCAYRGLNYSNVLDEENDKISDIKFAELAVPNEPIAYNVDYSVLIDDKIAKGFNFEFGEVKPLIDWLIEYKK